MVMCIVKVQYVPAFPKMYEKCTLTSTKKLSNLTQGQKSQLCFSYGLIILKGL
jgi:hypothetical protein